MNEARVPRWLDADSDASAELRELLGSADADEPSSEALGALGARLDARLEPPAGLPSADGGAPSTLALRVRLGVVIGLLGSAGLVYTALGEEPVPRLEHSVSSLPRVELPKSEPAAAAAPAAPAGPPVVAARPAVSAPIAVESEIIMLGRAHSALRGGGATEALSITIEHGRVHPRGKLSQEREMIAIEALARLGRRAEADARGQAFIRLFPTSSHARRVRSMLGLPSDGGS